MNRGKKDSFNGVLPGGDFSKESDLIIAIPANAPNLSPFFSPVKNKLDTPASFSVDVVSPMFSGSKEEDYDPLIRGHKSMHELQQIPSGLNVPESDDFPAPVPSNLPRPSLQPSFFTSKTSSSSLLTEKDRIMSDRRLSQDSIPNIASLVSSVTSSPVVPNVMIEDSDMIQSGTTTPRLFNPKLNRITTSNFGNKDGVNKDVPTALNSTKSTTPRGFAGTASLKSFRNRSSSVVTVTQTPEIMQQLNSLASPRKLALDDTVSAPMDLRKMASLKIIDKQLQEMDHPFLVLLKSITVDIDKFRNSIFYYVFIIICTLWVFVVPSVEYSNGYIYVEKPGLQIVTTIVFLFFVFDYMLKLVSKKQYSPVWIFLDMLAVFSVLPDSLFWDTFISAFFSSPDLTTSSIYLYQASISIVYLFVLKLDLVSSGSPRVILLCRCFRMILWVSLFDVFEVFRRYTPSLMTGWLVLKDEISRKVSLKETPEDDDEEEEDEEPDEEEIKQEENLQRSELSNKLSELTSQRIVLGIFFLLFLLVCLQSVITDSSISYDFNVIYNSTVALQQSNISVTAWNQTINYFVSHRSSILYLLTNDTVFVNKPNLYNSLKSYEMLKLSASSSSSETTMWVSLRSEQEINYLWNDGILYFLIFLISIETLWFTLDTNSLVFEPIERMISFVQQLASNPLAKIQQLKKGDELKKGVQFETLLIETTLKKLGGLLQVGFGVAGAEIIGKNMKGDRLDPMIPGKKIEAIFSFCDIRNFTDTTEVLEEKVMTFVNQVAEVVHGAAHRTGGASNKNVGDAFLLIWKFPPDQKVSDFPNQKSSVVDDGMMSIKRREVAKNRRKNPFKTLVEKNFNESSKTRIADRALIGIIQILIEVSKSPKLNAWRSNENILARMKSFDIRLGFGLHTGWAIEGALGSERKIDASYLSLHVNICVKLEEFTKHYDLPLLFSGEFYDLLSPAIQLRCRWLDSIVLPGRSDPLDVFTFDMTQEGIDLAQFRRNIATGEDAPLLQNSLIEANKGGRRLSLIADDSTMNVIKFTELARPRSNSCPTILPFYVNDLSSAVKLKDWSVVTPKTKRTKTLSSAKDKKVFDFALKDDRSLASTDNYQKQSSLLSNITDDSQSKIGLISPKLLDIASTRSETPGTSRRNRGSVNSIASMAEDYNRISTPVPEMKRTSDSFSPRKTYKKPYIVELIRGSDTDDLGAVQSGLPSSFVSSYNDAMQLYVTGNWPKSARLFNECLRMIPKDKPSANILEYMQKFNCKAPEGWRGFRD